MDETKSRRAFLKDAAYLLAGLNAFSISEALAGAPRPPAASTTAPLKISPWTGDDFTIGHRLRDGNMPQFPKATEKNVDFVIIGGGVAGLAAAYHLKDTNFLLLEQYQDLGGNSRGGNFQGIGYSWGAQYLYEVDGLTGSLLNSLGLKPVKLDQTKNSFWWENKWQRGVSGAQSNSLYRDFRRLQSELSPIWNAFRGKILTVPLNDPAMLKLDKEPMTSYLTGYSPAFRSLMEGFLKSSACGTSDLLSALTGTSILEDLVAPSYELEGGNPAIARALASRLKGTNPGKVVSGSFAWSVALNDKGASIVYSTSDGSVHRVNCRHVILAIPPMVAARILTSIKAKDKALMFTFRYGSFLVANLLLKKKIFSGSFDNWFGSPFTFTDMVVAETPYQMQGHYKPEMGSVLTVYQPYAPGTEGRTLLFEGDREKFARSIVSQLTPVLGPLESWLDQVVLTRWGHAMAVTGPGYYQQMTRILNNQSDNYSLAHSSFYGLPCLESAVKGARVAADRALKLKRKTAQDTHTL